MILVGEHAVVHGYAALAAGISTGISVVARAREGKARLRVPAWSLEATAGDGTPVGRALEAIVRRLETPGLDFEAEAQIPSRAGIGSSAALATAIARAAAAAVGRAGALEAIDAAITAAEEIFHGSPSGIDAAAAKSGVTGRFSRASGWHPVPVLQKITICVGLSGRPRDTAGQVAAVGRLRERLPAANEMLALLGRLADDAASALAKGDVDGLGRIMDASHGLLAGLRLSSPELETLVHGARAAGAVGAKLTAPGAEARSSRSRPDTRGTCWPAGAARDTRASWPTSSPRPAWTRGAAELPQAPEARDDGRHRRRRHEHRAGEVLGQARRGARPQPSGRRQSVAHARPARHAHARRLRRRRCGRRARSGHARRRARLREGGGACFDVSRSRSRARRDRGARDGGDRQQRATAAGLASSASGFAALALAAARAAGLALAPAELSELARLGSGSAARSIFGGFVEMARGARADGSDAVAHPLETGVGWDVRLVVAITAAGEKAIGSTAAMRRTAETSPYYEPWVRSVDGDLAAARAAIAARDLAALGAVAERSALRMHASAFAADPPIVYWNPATLAAMASVRLLRERGTPAFFTIDAGPHVKVLCDARDAEAVAAALAGTDGVLRTLIAAPGPGARVLEEA